MTEPLLKVDGLTVSVATSKGPITVVEDIGFDVMPGESVALVGESGCGKSVTAMSIMGLLQHTPGTEVRGSAVFDGRDLLTLDESEFSRVRGSEISMVFQDPMSSLNPALTVGEQIAEVLRRHRRLGRKAAAARAVEMLNLVGIAQAEKRARSYPHQFSGGMRQRVMIAIALACEPKLLLADEPTTALDTTVQAQILDLLVDLQATLNMALVMVTHDLGVVASTCDRVVVMYAGEVVERGQTEQIFYSPRHPYTAALLNCLPSGAEQTVRGIPGTVPLPDEAHPTCRFLPRCVHAVSGVCDVVKVPLAGAEGRDVRCARVHELELAGVTRTREQAVGR